MKNQSLDLPYWPEISIVIPGQIFSILLAVYVNDSEMGFEINDEREWWRSGWQLHLQENQQPFQVNHISKYEKL